MSQIGITGEYLRYLEEDCSKFHILLHQTIFLQMINSKEGKYLATFKARIILHSILFFVKYN